MKNNIFLSLVFILAVIFTASSQSNRKQKMADQNTEEWRYDAICNGSGGSDSSYLILVSVYVADQRLALEQAKKSAIHAVLFKGIVGNNSGCAQKNPIAGPKLESENSSYFNDFFFDSSLYSKFATSPTGVPKETIKLDPKGKQLRVNFVISVSIDNLRSQLEGDGILSSLAVDESVQKPSITIIPDDNFLKNNNFYSLNSRGEKVADYKLAFESDEVRTAIANLSDLLQRRGYQPINASAQMNSMIASKALDELNTGTEGNDTQVSDVDKLIAQTKADIFWKFSYNLEDDGFDKKLNYTVIALDAYMNTEIATETGEGSTSISASMPEMLKQAISDKMDAFLGKHQTHFKNIVDNGRLVRLEFRTFDGITFSDIVDEEYGDDLFTVIQGYIANRANNGNFTPERTDTQVNINSVSIPLMAISKTRFGEKEISNNAGEFLREFQKFLRSGLNIESQLLEFGLGRARLTIGAK